MNECQPVYNLFTCYGCRAQVCYQLGVSDVIRCTKCKTINKVPMSVKPNYQPARDIQDRRVVPEPIRAEELSGVRPMLAFRK
jgi:LSD1 subclass zinc finger protein